MFGLYLIYFPSVLAQRMQEIETYMGKWQACKVFINTFFWFVIVDCIQLISNLQEVNLVPTYNPYGLPKILHQAACNIGNQIVQNWSCQGE